MSEIIELTTFLKPRKPLTKEEIEAKLEAGIVEEISFAEIGDDRPENPPPAKLAEFD